MPPEETPNDPSLKPAPSSRQSKKAGMILLGTVLTVLIALFFVGLFPRLKHAEQLKEAAAYTPLISAKLLTLERSNQPIDLKLPSSTQALRVTPIWARIDGYIKNFYVDIGDTVEEGQLLLEIDTPEVERQLAQAKADHLKARAKLEIAKVSASRWQELFGVNAEAVSTQEVDEKNSTFQAVQAEVESAKANMERLEQIHGFNRLYAPFPGIITERNIDIGSLVSAGSQDSYQQLFQIAKTDIIRVFVNVPQPYFRLIKVGGQVDVKIQEFPDTVFKGNIARTSRSLDPLSRTLLTEIHIDNRDGELITGLYAEVFFHLTPDNPYYIVPTTSLIIRDGHPQVAIVDDQGIVALHVVQIGRDFGNTVEITSGCQEKERIVTNPTERIRQGIKIDVEHP